MRWILKWRWAILALWLAGAAILFATAPNMEQLVREKGQITVPDGAPSTVADELSRQMNEEEQDSHLLSTVLVFHHESGLTSEHLDQIKRGLNQLKENEQAGVASLITHLETPELESQMASEDGQTILVLLEANQGERSLAEVREDLYAAVQSVDVDHYFTGDWLIQEDVLQSSQDGLKRTEYITVIFILVILIIVFRSVVAPFIPLLTVGLSYVVSQSVVAYLVKYFDFPLSNFTQIFLVAVLFGIGTDYCILLISRFKEELAQRGDKAEAIIETYRKAGKTVFVAALAVLIGFTSIGFSNFVLYRSAVAVAIGIAVMLLALSTIVPFFMMTLGKAIFWPVKGTLEHKESGLWGAVGRFSLKRPVWALLIIAAVTVPALMLYKGEPSYNMLEEVGSKYKSVKAFDIISDSFGPGDSLPATVLLKSEKPLNNASGLALVERVSRELASVADVKGVRSASRPTGDVLDDFQVANQMDQLGSGLVEGGDGLGQIKSGLSEASKALAENAPQLETAAVGAKQLADGTSELKTGIEQLGAGLKQIEKGLRDGSVGAKELAAGMAQAKASADELAAASKQMLDSYEQIGGGLAQLTKVYSDTAEQQAKLAQGLAGLNQGLGGLAQKYPDLAQDPAFVQIQGTMNELQAGAAAIADGLKELNAQLAGLTSGLAQANEGYKQAADGQSQLAQGLTQLAAGIGELQVGIEQAADGQGQIVSKLPAITTGIDGIQAGGRELSAGFAELNSQLAELTSGLNQSVDGLSQVTDGLDSAHHYLNGLSSAPDKQLAGWFIPEEALENEQFNQVFDNYFSKDGTIASFTVVFDTNPYSVETLKKTDDLQAAVDRAIKGTEYEQVEYAVGGVSSVNNDLRNVSTSDYSRTVMLMLIGIGLILIILFRSLVIPLYTILSLLLTYFTSIAIAEVIFVHWAGLSGLSWAVPFFSFVLLIALGVDYSIFLLDRFREYRELPAREGILKAMGNMGGVIISAAVILGGTFAAMLPSGVLSLLQIATIVLVGLFLYALIMLPLFIPVMVRTFGEANWWPLMKKDHSQSN